MGGLQGKALGRIVALQGRSAAYESASLSSVCIACAVGIRLQKGVLQTCPRQGDKPFLASGRHDALHTTAPCKMTTLSCRITWFAPLERTGVPDDKGVCNALVIGRTRGCWCACFCAHTAPIMSAWGRWRSQADSPFPKMWPIKRFAPGPPLFLGPTRLGPRLHFSTQLGWRPPLCDRPWERLIPELDNCSDPQSPFPSPRSCPYLCRWPLAFVPPALPCCLALPFYGPPHRCVSSRCLVAPRLSPSPAFGSFLRYLFWPPPLVVYSFALRRTSFLTYRSLSPSH